MLASAVIADESSGTCEEAGVMTGRGILAVEEDGPGRWRCRSDDALEKVGTYE